MNSLKALIVTLLFFTTAVAQADNSCEMMIGVSPCIGTQVDQDLFPQYLANGEENPCYEVVAAR